MLKSLAKMSVLLPKLEREKLLEEPEMEDFFLPEPFVPIELLPDVSMFDLSASMIGLNMVSRDEFDCSQYDLNQFEAHFEELEDHIDCMVCAYYRTCTFALQPPTCPPCSQFSGRASPINVVG